MKSVMPDVVVLVPGIMGSRLARGEREVWPGSVADLVRHMSEDEFQALLDPDAQATDVIRSYFISTQYQALIDDLERWGFHEKNDPPTLYSCPYDWRRSQSDAARTLAALLDRIAKEHDGSASVTLIAHSMGGLVSRYYLESGQFTTRPAYAMVTTLVMLGTPHRGAPEALLIALGQEGRLWLKADQAARLANDERYPSTYELLPHPSEPFAWDEGAGQRLARVDIHDDAMAARLGLSRANLAAAARFREGLRGPTGAARYFCFYGTRQKTTSLVAVRSRATDEIDVLPIEPEDSGDGTVPDWSGRLPGIQSLSVGGAHSILYKNGDVRRNLATLLGVSAVQVEAVTPRIELSLRHHIVRLGRRVHGVLAIPSPGASALRGRLVFELARETADHAAIFSIASIEHPIEYRGVAADAIRLAFEAPNVPGAYRISYIPADDGDERRQAATDELFVIKDD